LELAICEAAVRLRAEGRDEFYGYAMARSLKGAAEARLLTAYGTLYRALGRLEQMGLLESRWEDPAIATAERRPPRRLYRVTAEGEAAVRRAGQRDLVPDLGVTMALALPEVG
jgi:DNA-binding PadR family transcriptional regulator